MQFTYSYPRPALTVDAIVVAYHEMEKHILLVQRSNEPFRNFWALPGGFVNMDETLEEACLRELMEETGIALANMKQFRAFDAVSRDPRDRTISIVFFACLPEILEAKGGDDAALAFWFPIKELPQLAFDHADIIRRFLESYQSGNEAESVRFPPAIC